MNRREEIKLQLAAAGGMVTVIAFVTALVVHSLLSLYSVLVCMLFWAAMLKHYPELRWWRREVEDHE